VLLGEIARDGVGMINKKNVCVVLPAYNAARTLERTLREIPTDVVDDIILVDHLQVHRRAGPRLPVTVQLWCPRSKHNGALRI
jgi:hypothetical protein